MLFVQVIGKALMLDEIINYVQSLQRQVEVSSRACSNYPMHLKNSAFEILTNFTVFLASVPLHEACNREPTRLQQPAYPPTKRCKFKLSPSEHALSCDGPVHQMSSLLTHGAGKIQMFQACGPSASSVFSLESSSSGFPFSDQGDVFQSFVPNGLENQCGLNPLDLALSHATNGQYGFQDGTAGTNLQVN
jgi:hypothetical protein